MPDGGCPTKSQRVGAAIRHKKLRHQHFHNRFTYLCWLSHRAQWLMHFAGIKHHEVAFVQDDGFLPDARR